MDTREKTIMKFRLRQMEVFRAVMLTGSIKAASQLLFASQPAVSRIIAHTEQTLGLTLFNRVKGKLVPTPEGEALYREVDEFYHHASADQSLYFSIRQTECLKFCLCRCFRLSLCLSFSLSCCFLCSERRSVSLSLGDLFCC